MGVVGLEKCMTLANIMKGFSTTCIWPLNLSAMDDKIMSIEVFVNIAVEINKVNEEKVGEEEVEEVC